MSKHAMTSVNKKWLIDAGERVGMTVAYAGVSEAIVQLSGLNQAWVPTLIVGLTALKTIIAKKVGSPSSASLVPSVANPPAEPAPAPVVDSPSTSVGQETA